MDGGGGWNGKSDIDVLQGPVGSVGHPTHHLLHHYSRGNRSQIPLVITPGWTRPSGLMHRRPVGSLEHRGGPQLGHRLVG